MTPVPYRSKHRGVTLFELAVALAVTAVVVAVAYSAYATHLVRAEIASTVEAAAAAQRRVEEAFERDSEPPAGRSEANLWEVPDGLRNRHVESLAIVDGRIDLHFGPGANAAIAGRVLSLTPFETAAKDVVWICGNRLPGAGLQPLGFAAGGRQAVQVVTRIDSRYLPQSCR